MVEGALVGRRRFLAYATTSATLAVVAPAQAALHLAPPRALAFENLHTGERLKTVYWADGRYVVSGLRQINWILRDFRTGDVVPIDRELLDALFDLQRRLHTAAPFEVISGYRSPRTNAIL